jgi:hypothetical protein
MRAAALTMTRRDRIKDETRLELIGGQYLDITADCR